MSDQWQNSLTTKLAPDLYIYSVRDYRRFLSAHVQLLAGLCKLTGQLVHDSVDQFHSSSFVTAQLLPPNLFNSTITSHVQQSQSNANTTFTRLLSLLRVTNHGNAIISAYGTNFQMVAPWYDITGSSIVTESMWYDDNCSCALNGSCTSAAVFMGTDLSVGNITIQGLRMGCTPSEALFSSTLECFYNSTCINLIQQHINATTATSPMEEQPSPLSPNNTRFSVNAKLSELVEELFIERWSTSISYAGYFNQCAVSVCSYSYNERVDPLYTVTFLLGLYGGLTFVLKWICPKIVYLVERIYQRWKRRRNNTITPICTIEMTTTVNTTLATTTTTTTTAAMKSINDRNECVDRGAEGWYVSACLYSIALIRYDL